jgi:hypothetical protein
VEFQFIMESSFSNEPVTDLKAPLDAADVLLLEKKLKRNLRVWTSWTVAGAVLLPIWIEPSFSYAWQYLLFYLIVCGFIWHSMKKKIERNQKFITRGEISARWARGSEGERQGVMSSFTVVVNGKQINVDKSQYKKYFTRDFVEFHYLSDGLLLNDKLLRRGMRR